MVTSKDGTSDENPADRLQQRQSSQSPDTKKHASLYHLGVCDISMVRDKVSHSKKVTHERVSNNLQQQGQGNGSGNCTSQAKAEECSASIIPKKESDNSLQGQSTDSGVYMSHSSQEGSLLSIKTEMKNDDLRQKQNTDNGIHVSRSKQEGSMLSPIPEKVSEISQERPSPNCGVPALQFEQVNHKASVRSQKVLEKLPLRRKPESSVHVLNSCQEGNTILRIPEKVSEDGYNWRKYGQKFVKGNKFIRSYYKCTYPNCQAKKQVERSHEGPIMDINYVGKHEHSKCDRSPHAINSFGVSVKSRRSHEPALPIARDKSPNEHGMALHQTEPKVTPQPSNVAASDDVEDVAASQPSKMGDGVDVGDQYSKRQKQDISNVENTLASKPSSESRFVVQTMSEIDIVNDGYRWRKYGQKLVKGNPNPRSYYRCSNTGCPAKKHVERASHDPTLVVTTYEGQHAHEMSLTRTATAGANMSTAVVNSDPRSKPEENGAVSVDVVVHIDTI